MAITKETRTQFINFIAPLAQKVCKDRGYGNAQIWTCIAQAACESAYGTSSLMKKANAFFGIKGGQGWLDAGHKLYSTRTKECYDGSTYVTITDSFRAYDTPLESVEDYFNLISNNRYKASLTQTTVRDCITKIKEGGYATDPNYVNTICNFYNNDKDLIESFTVDNASDYKLYRVKVQTVLNVRKGAGTNYEVVRQLKPNTIVAVKRKADGWGYVPAQGGWICMDYTECV